MAEYGAVFAVIAVAAAAVSTYANVKQAEQQAELSDAIKKQKEIDAQTAAETAAFEEQQHRRRVALLIGKQQAITAAAGVETTSGTPLIQEIDLAQQGELEALTIRRGGAIQAAGATFESRIARFRRDTARGSVPLTIAGGVLQAGASGYQTYRLSQPRTVTSDWYYRHGYGGT